MPQLRQKLLALNKSGAPSEQEPKMFAQEFFNLKRSGDKRDLKGISLHNHPNSYLDGLVHMQQTRALISFNNSGFFGSEKLH